MLVLNYKDFMKNDKRKKSGELDFGMTWGLTDRDLRADKWRVSYIYRTKELYAVNLRTGVVILLGKFDRFELEMRMKGWQNFENQVLRDFFQLPNSVMKKVKG